LDANVALNIAQNIYVSSNGNLREVLDWLEQSQPNHLDYVMGFITENIEIDKPEEGDAPRLPWYRAESEDVYWPAYKKLLLSKGVQWVEAAESIESTTFSILNQFPNPSLGEDKFVGLVIGDVQSGKTAHFTGILARAIDKGYNFVIVLSGIYNNLRSQTQDRLTDELLENPFLEQQDVSRFISLTNTGEFIGNADLNPFIVDDFSKIALAVTKKNPTSLRAFRSWLKSLPQERLQSLKLLIIDDEADFATLNTTNPNEPNSTTINSLVRSVLNMFSFSAYLGYTATPYANLLIQKSKDHTEFEFDEGEIENLGLTLHPRDMIFKINPSENYAGINRYFGHDYHPTGSFHVIPENENTRLVRFFDKPERGNIPESLKYAVIEFILVQCIRIVIGEREFENKMMIHTIRETEDMFPIGIVIRDMLEHWRNNPPDSSDYSNEYYQIFSHLWDNRFSDHFSDISFSDVEDRLRDVLRDSKFVLLNQQDQQARELGFETSLRSEAIVGKPTIVIGGDLLSRGITIDGLTVSYFSRKSQNYDSLFQMGRWFGYPKTDFILHRVYLFEEELDKFRFLGLVNLDLEREVREYTRQIKTPIDFSCRVLLPLNARNFSPTSDVKMANAELFSESTGIDGLFKLPPFDLNHDNDDFLKIVTQLNELASRYTNSSSYNSRIVYGISQNDISHTLLQFEKIKSMNEIISAINDWANRNGNENWNLIFYNPANGRPFEYEIMGINSLKIVAENAILKNSGIENIQSAAYIFDFETTPAIPRVGDIFEQLSQVISLRSEHPPLMFLAIIEPGRESQISMPRLMIEIILPAREGNPRQLTRPYCRLNGTFSSGRY